MINNELIDLQNTIYTSKNPTRRYLHNVRKNWIEKKILEHAKYDGTSLEIGPGCGIYLPLLARNFNRCLALDIERSYIENSLPLKLEHPNLEFLIDDITQSSLPDNSIDLILCTEVIEHIKD